MQTDASSGQRLDYDFNVSHDSNAIIMVSQLNPGDFRLGVDIMRKGLPTGIPSVLEFAATVDDMVSHNA